jgi:putative hydrolase of HD superfamily
MKMQNYKTFGELFKKYRLRSEFETLSSFGNALAQRGYIYEDSIYSHWQKNTRVPKDRKLLLEMVKIFINSGGITQLKEVQLFFNSAGQGFLTDEEQEEITRLPNFQKERISPPQILNFLLETVKAKRVIRTGWKMHNITNPESVAEHSYQLCVIALVLADHLGVDREKLVKMAIIHDLGEIITGDIVWIQGKMIDVEKKRKKELMEEEGIKKIFSLLGDSTEYQTIFDEMLQRKSIESEVFWQIDKLELIVQAFQYEVSEGKDLSEFFVNANLHITHPFFREIFQHILSLRTGKKDFTLASQNKL